MSQGAAGRGPGGTDGQGKKSEKTVQGDQPVHYTGLYRKRLQWVEQAEDKILAPDKEFPVGERWEMLHENRHRQHERLALDAYRRHASGEDGRKFYR